MRRRLAFPLLAVILLLLAAAGPSAQSSATGDQFVLRAPAARVQEIATRYGLTIVRRLAGQDVFLVRKSAVGFLPPPGSGDSAPSQETAVAADPFVVGFEPNATITTPEVVSPALNGSVVSILDGSVVSILDGLSGTQVITYFDNQVWVHYVEQPAAAAIGLAAGHAAATGAGIVAVIDTGIDPNHPALAGSLVPGYDFIHESAGTASEWTDLDGSVVSILDGSVVSILDGQSLVTLNGSVVAILDQHTAASLDASLLPRSFGHGTMVAGLVHLVAPTARIMPLKAFSADGTSNVFDVVRAIYFAVDHGARVINMSFSSTVRTCFLFARAPSVSSLRLVRATPSHRVKTPPLPPIRLSSVLSRTRRLPRPRSSHPR